MISKYGDAHRQLRALTILDALMQNAGPRFQKRFADEPLMERLRILPTDDMVDLDVRKKCNQLYRGWAVTYKDTPGMQNIATLHKQLPKKQRPATDQNKYKVIRDTEREAQENPFGTEEEALPSAPATPPPGSRRTSVNAGAPSTPPSSSSPSHSHSRTPSRTIADPDYASGGIWGHYTLKSKSKHKHSSSQSGSGSASTPKVFDLAKEKSNMLSSIAGASVASTNLLNSLRHLNRETSLPSSDPDCLKRFETCKALRRQILRYIQLVESEQWIGGLLNANDELVKALIAFEVADKGVDEDSDSEEETDMYNDPTKGLTLRSKAGGDAEPEQAAAAVQSPSRRASHATGQHRAAPPPPRSAPASRRTSLTQDMGGMSLGGGGGEAPPQKPPRPVMHLPPQAQADPRRRSVVAGGAQHAHPPLPTPIREGNEDDDPFGDANAL